LFVKIGIAAVPAAIMVAAIWLVATAVLAGVLSATR